MDNVDDLPQGFKERMDNATNKIIAEALRAMNLCEEFACNNVVLTGEGVTVTIERESDDKLERENDELLKDKERLDWLLNYEGNYWLLDNREDIDKAMEEAQ